MRGACACAVMLALMAVVAGGVDQSEDNASLDETTRAAAEKQLLALMGLSRRPPRRKRSPPPVPQAMRSLYNAHGVLPASSANTVRSFHHVSTELDDRFPHEHRFRLFFNISSIPDGEVARGADLHFQRITNATPGQRLLVFDVVRPGKKGISKPILRLIDSVSHHSKDGVVKVDGTSAVKRWLEEPKENHGLLVRVIDSEGENALKSNIRVKRQIEEKEEDWRSLQPILLVYTEDVRAREARGKRSVSSRRRRGTLHRGHRAHHRRKDSHDVCQRRSLYIDFSDVGWSDWILAPTGYEAYHCQGECHYPLSDHYNATNHAIVQTLVNSVNPGTVPKACCVPTELSQISILYMDETNNVVLKYYQDMMVEACGCR